MSRRLLIQLRRNSDYHAVEAKKDAQINQASIPRRKPCRAGETKPIGENTSSVHYGTNTGNLANLATSCLSKNGCRDNKFVVETGCEQIDTQCDCILDWVPQQWPVGKQFRWSSLADTCHINTGRVPCWNTKFSVSCIT